MRLPPWIQAVLDSFEVREDPFMEISVADALRAARNSQGILDDPTWAAFLAEHSAFMFFEQADEDSVWSTYFAPMMEGTKADGSPHRAPDINELTAETVKHWEERASATTNPIMRARYADCVWDLERVICKAKRQYRFALVAAKSYVENVQRNGFIKEPGGAADMSRALDIEGVQQLARALAIARSVNDKSLVSSAASELIDFCARHGVPGAPGIWLAPFDELYGEKDLLSSAQRDSLISNLEAMLARTTGQINTSDFDPWAAQYAAQRLITHYNDKEHTQRLVLAYGRAFETMAQDASPLLAIAWLQPLIEAYQQVGLKQESERLALAAAEKGKRIREDLKTVSVEVPFDRDAFIESVERLLAGDHLRTKLHLIAREFTPSATAVKNSVDQMSEGAPLLAMISRQIVAPEGHTVAQIGSVEEDYEGRMQSQTARLIGILVPLLCHTLAELKRRDQPTTGQIVDILFECPLFSDDRRSLVVAGIDAYLAEDWLKSIHVLIPQMEEALRNLLSEIGIPVTKTLTRQPGLTDVKNMGDVLSDPRIKQVLGETKSRFLTVLYTDKRGMNLRNDVAHGLVGPETFSRPTADLVFLSFLVISALRRVPQAQPDL